MNNQEAIDIIRVAIAEIEWNYPMEYAAAFDMAIEALEKQVAVEPVSLRSPAWSSPWCSGMYFCGKCKYPVRKHDNYCSQCGRKVKWNGQGEG